MPILPAWDTANKPTELADYSVCTTWGVKGMHFYLLDVLRKKLAYPGPKRAVVEQRARFNPSLILVEDKTSGTQLIQKLIEGGLSMVMRCKPDGDKIMRLHAQTATIENGFVHVPREEHWLADYLQELIIFPNGRYDDQVDSTSRWIPALHLRQSTCSSHWRMETNARTQRGPRTPPDSTRDEVGARYSAIGSQRPDSSAANSYKRDVNWHADRTPIHTQGRRHKTDDTARRPCGWQRYAGPSTEAFGDRCSVFLSTRRVRLPRQVKQKWCKVCRLSGEKPVGNETVYGPHCI